MEGKKEKPLTPVKVLVFLHKLARENRGHMISFKELLEHVRQNVPGDYWTGSLELQLEAVQEEKTQEISLFLQGVYLHLHHLISYNRVSIPRQGFYLPTYGSHPKKPPPLQNTFQRWDHHQGQPQATPHNATTPQDFDYGAPVFPTLPWHPTSPMTAPGWLQSPRQSVSSPTFHDKGTQTPSKTEPDSDDKQAVSSGQSDTSTGDTTSSTAATSTAVSTTVSVSTASSQLPSLFEPLAVSYGEFQKFIEKNYENGNK